MIKKFLKHYTPGINFLRLVLFTALTATLLIWLSSCSPIQRLNRMHKRHPTLFNRENDTIRLIDTLKIMIPGTKADTSLSVRSLMQDTVVIYRHGVTTKIFINKDTLYLQNKTDTIYKTIIREIDVPYKKYITTNLPRDKLRWYDILIILGAMIATVSMIQNTINKRKQDK